MARGKIRGLQDLEKVVAAAQQADDAALAQAKEVVRFLLGEAESTAKDVSIVSDEMALSCLAILFKDTPVEEQVTFVAGWPHEEAITFKWVILGNQDSKPKRAYNVAAAVVDGKIVIYYSKLPPQGNLR
jgi:hypothetical protein